jgi:hypothetical protein
MSHYCDPILAAGYRWCPQCRTESFPVDATWLGTDLILATFGPLCRHRPEAATLTVTPSAMTPHDDRCRGLTAAGTRCRKWPQLDSDYCHKHAHQRAAP